jgi:tripartite-type tricarboxylate transporter receptor subunit TctC
LRLFRRLPQSDYARRPIEKHSMQCRRHFLATLVLAPFAATNSTLAMDWPQRPVRIIYPYAAGGTGDATSRLIAARLGEVFGQAFIVENRPGANGIVATETVARSPADGYTLLFAITPQIAIAPAMAKVPYDPVKDFAPIGTISSNRFALAVNPKVPVRTVAEFLDYVRAQPKGFAYAEGGAGSISHLAMVLLLNRAGLSGTNVSYKSSEQALLDVIAGQLPACFAVFTDALPHAQSGAVRMIAVSSAQRSPLAPDVPTVAESGFSGYQATSWWGLMAPAGTPRPIVDRIATEVARADNDPQMLTQFAKFGIDPLSSGPSEFATMVAADIAL